MDPVAIEGYEVYRLRNPMQSAPLRGSENPREDSLEELRASVRQVDVQGAPARAVERLEIPHGLGLFQHPKGIRLARDGKVFRRRGGHDDEDAVVGAALVQLPRRVQVAGTVSERRGAPPRAHDGGTELPQRRRKDCVLRGEVREQSEIVAGPDQTEKGQRIV